MYKIYLIPALMDTTRNYIYYIIDEETELSAVIDPGDAKPILDFLKENNFKPDFILNTHHHWDHVNGNLQLKIQFGLKIIANDLDKHRIPGVDIVVNYGEKFKLGNLEFEIIHTPGHTKNHIAFYSKKANLLFCGDTMFSAGCGGLFEGTPDDMLISFKKFYDLPNETKVYCAHEYTLSNLDFARCLQPNNERINQRIKQCKFFAQMKKPTLPSTILVEKETNPFMKFNDKDMRKVLSCNESDSESKIFNELMRKKSKFYNRD